MKHLLLALMLFAVPALAASPRVEEARALVAQLKYQEAATALAKLERDTTLDLEDYRVVLELSGIVQGTLKQSANALESFKKLLAISPGYELSGSYSPRVMTPYYSAKTWARDAGSLELKRLDPVITDRLVSALRFELVHDALALAKQVRLHWRADGGAWQVALVPSATTLSFRVQGTSVDAWLEVLGDAGRVIQRLGTESKPLREAAAAPAPVASVLTPPPPPAPLVVSPAPAPAANSGSGLKTAGYFLGGTGVAALGVGVFFGIQSSTARKTFADAPVDEQGISTTLTREQALALDAQARSSGSAANILFGVGGGLVVAGGVCWLIGNQAGTQVAIIPAANGVSVAGTFP